MVVMVEPEAADQVAVCNLPRLDIVPEPNVLVAES